MTVHGFHPSNRPTLEALDALFTFHPPRDEAQLDAYLEIRVAGRMLAEKILTHCPGCADQSDAVRKVREAVMTANAAIALEPAPPEAEG